MNKKIIFYILTGLGILLLVLGYKLFLLNKYNSEETTMNVDNIFAETLTINDTVTMENEILRFKKLAIKNYFKEYEENNENTNIKVKYDNEGKVISFYSISNVIQYINMLNINSFDINYINNEENDFKTEESMKLYLEENKIENDIELLKYIKNNYYIENNIFMSKKAMENNFIINSFAEITLPDFEKIVLINGNITGYIINMNNSNIKEIHLLYNDEQYIILLSGDEITNNEFIVNLLETVTFDN